MAIQLETDYLIAGSGAVGMAFADTLVTESEATMIIVDRYPKPGGHWNVAYPFVTLHQPSAFYGVSSAELGNRQLDTIGLNKGLQELASGAEVLSYFDKVMKNYLLPSGRVQYFPMCEYRGDNKFVSLITGEEYVVSITKKFVDATFLNTSVPSMHTPSFTIAPEVQFIPLNDLPKIKKKPEGFVVIGGGKTGIDACLWLLEQKVNPDNITWVVSRDAWLSDRLNTQPSMNFFKEFMGAQAAQFESVAQSTSIDDMFDRLEKSGVLVRIDTTVKPKMFHGATISQLELAELRRIKNIVRKGRVSSIEKDKIVLVEGTIPTSPSIVHVDCSASAIPNLKIIPVFKNNVITPQTVRSVQPVFSAAFIAHVELAYDGEDKKNEICQVVPLPNHDTDWIKMLAVYMQNQFNWSQDKELRKWLYNNRLEGFAKLVADRPRDNPEHETLLKRMKENSFPAVIKLQQYIGELEAKES